MASRILNKNLCKYLQNIPQRSYSVAGDCHRRDAIGCREVVGHGYNSECTYIDMPGFPYPAIRFMEPTPDILALRQREKGDWRSLSLEEKKCLYRASFCQTYAEMNASHGIWKSIVGRALFWLSMGIWVFWIMRFLLPVPLPESFCEDRRRAQKRRMLTLGVNPIHGISRNWDLSNDCPKNE